MFINRGMVNKLLFIYIMKYRVVVKMNEVGLRVLI